MKDTSLLGQTILDYKVVEVLGSGSFGTVYKVIKKNESGEYVRALKHIKLPSKKQYASILNTMGGDVEKANDYINSMLNNIISEVRILNDLSEKNVPNVIRYYENDIVKTDSPRSYDINILMEYLTPLDDFIYKNGFTVKDVVYLGLDVLNGLKACHNNGIIHRDIKMDNIFVDSNLDYKIGDFGVSKVLENSTRADSLKGTFDYLAPEVYLGKESYTNSVDLYSLGILLYRLLNYNRNPFLPAYPEQYYIEDEDKAFAQRINGNIPDLPLLGGEAIGKVILKAIATSDNRYTSAEEFYKGATRS